MSKVLFLTAGPMNWYSSKARCFWIAERMQDAKAVQYEHLAEHIQAGNIDLGHTDVIVFQKIFDTEFAKMAHSLGKSVMWDICDPLYWFDPDHCKEVVKHCDMVVCSNPGLTRDFTDWCNDTVPAITIADRVKLDNYPLRREHRKSDPVRLIWFGLGVNRFAVMGALANLERLVANGYKIELTIQDDQPNVNWQHVTNAFPVYHTQFRVESENQVLASHDVAILPPYPGAWGKVKSNNRMITAWACGLPVADGFDYEELVYLLDPAIREAVAAENYQELIQDWLIEKSAAEWEALCE
jgi:hypothetical protein